MKVAVAILLAILTAGPLFSADTPATDPVPYGPAEFAPWQRDLRRAEILSFGALPFVTFMASIYFDIYRYADHDGDEGYLPWPFKKSEVAVPLTEREQKNILYASAGLSVGVALFDYAFRYVFRNIRESRAEKAERLRVDPIVIVPLVDGTPAASPGGLE